MKPGGGSGHQKVLFLFLVKTWLFKVKFRFTAALSRGRRDLLCTASSTQNPRPQQPHHCGALVTLDEATQLPSNVPRSVGLGTGPVAGARRDCAMQRGIVP